MRNSRATLVVVLIGFLAVTGLAYAQAPLPSAPAAEPDEEHPRREASRLFDQANLHYELGEYAQAVPLFRRAYELWREPVLLFNLAQAYRLSGDCQRAVEAYRQFVRLADESPLRPKAEAQLEALRASCPPVAAAPPPRTVAPALPPAASPATPAPSEGGASTAGQLWRTVGMGAVAAGLVAAAGAGVIHLWNGGRYDDWRDEGEDLDRTKVDLSVMNYQDRVEANDQLWLRVSDTERTALRLAVGGAVLAAGGVALWYFADRADAATEGKRRSVAFAITPTGFVGRFTWP